MEFKEIDGLRIAFRANESVVAREGKTLFFIHGSAGDHTVWENQYADMGGEFNIIAVDLPGHGQSGGSGEREVALYAQWVKKAMEVLCPQKPVLIGHSLGAAVALESAIRYGDMLSGIVAVGGGAKMPVNPLVLEGFLGDPSTIINSIPEFAVSKKNRERLRDLLIDNLSRADKNVAHGDFFACDRFNVSEELEQIRIPTLLICGEDDRMMPPKFSTYLKEQIRGAELVLIKEAGHFVMMEDVKAFNAALREFVDTLE